MRKGRQPARKIVNEQRVLSAANTAQGSKSAPKQPSRGQVAKDAKPRRQGLAPPMTVEGAPRKRPDIGRAAGGYSTYGTMANRGPTNDRPDARRQTGPSSVACADPDAWAEQADRRDGYPRPDRYTQSGRDAKLQPTTATPRSVNIRDNKEPARGILESYGKPMGAEQVLPAKTTPVPTDRLSVAWWFGNSGRKRVWSLPPEERGAPQTPNA